MINQTVQIKKTKMETPEFRGAIGRVIRITSHGYLVVETDDNRQIILHPESVLPMEVAS